MDPSAEGNLGVTFSNEIVKIIANKRSNVSRYSEKDTYLKTGKGGKGRSVTGENKFGFKNASVMREFFLSRLPKKGKGKNHLRCDVVMMDLDSSDSLILAIENKLFSTNHLHQLENYYEAIEEKYKTIKTREYVYLTLLGEKPIDYGEGKLDSNILNKEWVCISWIEDILPILESLSDEKGVNNEITRLCKLLNWIKELIDPPKDIKNIVDSFLDFLTEATSLCLVDELNRLSKIGEWSQKENTKSSIIYSSKSEMILSVQILPYLFITVQGKRHSKNLYEKILIPFGFHPDQVFHMFYIAANDIFSNLGSIKKTNRNLNKERPKNRTDSQKNIEPLLEFVHKYKHHLLVLLSLSNQVKEANKNNEIYEYSVENEV